MILVATPIHGAGITGLDLLLKQWSAWDLPDLNFIVVLNGQLSLNAVHRLRELSKAYSHLPLETAIMVNGHFEGWGALCAAQNLVRERVLSENYSHLLWHEVSRVASKSDLCTMLEYRLEIAGALYKDTYHPGFYCAYQFNNEKQCHVMRPYYKIDEIVTPSKVWGIGFGFTLICRNVLERVRFRCGKFASDTYFWADVYDLGVPVFACPVFVENLKVDRDKTMLRLWRNKRKEFGALGTGDHWDHE